MNELIIQDWKILDSPEGFSGAWITGEELGRHLGYSEPRIAISKIYKRHSQFFKEQVDIGVTNLVTPGGIQEVRIFSERGALKIIRYSNTEKADEIMDEVFDVFLAVKNQQQFASDELALMEKYKNTPAMQRSRQLLGKTGYYSILAYANITGRHITRKEVKRLGQQATKLSKKCTYIIGTVPDDRWGRVNTYHVDILEEVFS